MLDTYLVHLFFLHHHEKFALALGTVGSWMGKHSSMTLTKISSVEPTLPSNTYLDFFFLCSPPR